MGWVFKLDSLLNQLNQARRRQDRPPLSWAQIAPLLGMSRQALQNLASNRELKATNTRFLEAICRFFQCHPNQVLVFNPPLDRDPIDQDEIDRLIALGPELGPPDRPTYHVEVIYGNEATARWNSHRAVG